MLRTSLITGATVTGVAIVLIGANIVGWPEVEAVEGAAATAGGSATATMTQLFAITNPSEQAVAIATSSLHFGAYGAVAGGTFGALSTNQTESCIAQELGQFLKSR